MACMKIDYRKEIDSWCKDQPKVLADDSTYIGIALHHLNLQHPSTETDNPQSHVTQQHKR